MRAHAGTECSPALAHVARRAAVAAVVLGTVFLAGWWLGLTPDTPLWPSHTRMVPNSALMLFLLGLALWLVVSESAPSSFRVYQRAGQVIAAGSALLGLGALLEEVLHSRVIGINFLQFHLVLSLQALPGRSAFPTALGALGIGLGIVLLDGRIGEVWLSEVFALVTMQIALLAVIGQLFGVPELYGSLHFRPDSGMALYTALGFLVLGLGLLCVRAERGVMAVVRSDTPGGTLARRWALTPAAVLLVMGFVYLALRPTEVAKAIGTWALLMSSFTFLTAVTWATAHALHRTGLERDEVQRTLEERVQQRTAELNKTNEALEQAKDQLAQANQDLEKTVQERTAHLKETIGSLETVCYNIAHDLRAPNRAIAGFAQVLLADPTRSLDSNVRECLRRIAAAAQRSDALTVDLLAYGRLGHADLPCSKQGLKNHLDAVVEKLAPEIAAGQASLELPAALPEVWANAAALEQVFTNLLSNALNFVSPGVRPRVTIRTEDGGAYCRVLVQDNGIGIPAEYQQRIFEVFQRLHPQEEYAGTGIGLAIVQKAVERMGGRVGVTSSLGDGSCFWFELPKAPMASA